MDFFTCPTPPEPIGTYRFYMGGGMHGTTPIYGTRDQFLPLVGETAFQVQIKGFGGLYWINVKKDDITLK
jgi:hypothetical protein